MSFFQQIKFTITLTLPLCIQQNNFCEVKNAQNYLLYLKSATLMHISQILIKIQKLLTYFWKRKCPTKVLSTLLLKKINIKRFKRD